MIIYDETSIAFTDNADDMLRFRLYISRIILNIEKENEISRSDKKN
jgi:hypothetical protein